MVCGVGFRSVIVLRSTAAIPPSDRPGLLLGPRVVGLTLLCPYAAARPGLSVAAAFLRLLLVAVCLRLRRREWLLYGISSTDEAGGLCPGLCPTAVPQEGDSGRLTLAWSLTILKFFAAYPTKYLSPFFCLERSFIPLCEASLYLRRVRR